MFKKLGLALLILFNYSIAQAQWNNCASGFCSASAVAVVATAFDPASNANTSLSNNNLTCTHTTTTVGGCRSISYKNSGKFCVTYTVTAAHGLTDAPAIAAASYSYGNINAGNTGTGVVWYGNNGGHIFSGGSDTFFNLGALVQGDVINVAVDIDHSNTWWQRNGGQWNGNGTSNPATNTNGAVITPVQPVAPAIGFSGISGAVIGDNITANFSNTACSGQLPAGFQAGWPQ